MEATSPPDEIPNSGAIVEPVDEEESRSIIVVGFLKGVTDEEFGIKETVTVEVEFFRIGCRDH